MFHISTDREDEYPHFFRFCLFMSKRTCSFDSNLKRKAHGRMICDDFIPLRKIHVIEFFTDLQRGTFWRGGRRKRSRRNQRKIKRGKIYEKLRYLQNYK